MTIEIKSHFWTYATGFYAQEPIQQKCLELQDVYGANVDMILWLCWLDSNRLHLPPAALDEALTIVGGINQELLGGLRELRGKLIAGSNFTRVQEQLVRKHILAAELAIEKILLQRLQDFTSRLSPVGPEDECLSLFDYLERFAIERSGQVAAYLLDEGRQFGFNLEAQEQEAVVGG
jgi:uncharacterized protein (TIGR02444 family)